MTTACDHAKRPLTGRTVLFYLLGFFAVVFAVNGLMAIAAIATFGGVETASSYQAGLRFSRETAAVEAQEQRGWQVAIRSGERGAIEIVARDRADRPLAGLNASARLSHPLDQRLDRVLAMREVGAGVYRADAGSAVGQWDLMLELAQRDQPMFRSRNRLTLR